MYNREKASFPVVHRIVIKDVDAEEGLYCLTVETRHDIPADPWEESHRSNTYSWPLYNYMIDKAAKELVPRTYTVNVYHEGVNNPIEVLPAIKKASK